MEFYLNGSRIVLEAGSAWYLRLTDPHRVYNKGDSDRVHMVIDAPVNDWLKDLLETAAWQPHEPRDGRTYSPSTCSATRSAKPSSSRSPMFRRSS